MRKAAFSLIELLVVVAIISVLAALLLPVLENAVMEARFIACMNRQRQIGFALPMYCEDYGGRMPAVWWNSKFYAFEDIWNDHKPINLGVLYAARYLEDPSLIFCPDHNYTGEYLPVASPRLNYAYLNGAFSLTGGGNSNNRPTYFINDSSGDPYWGGGYDGAPLATIWRNNLAGGGAREDYDTHIRSPRLFLYCAAPSGSLTDDYECHSSYGVNVLFVDGVVVPYRCVPGDPVTLASIGTSGKIRDYLRVIYPGYRPPD